MRGSDPVSRLGLIAGCGSLPARGGARAARGDARPSAPSRFEGLTDPALARDVDELRWHKLGQLEAAAASLRSMAVRARSCSWARSRSRSSSTGRVASSPTARPPRCSRGSRAGRTTRSSRPSRIGSRGRASRSVARIVLLAALRRPGRRPCRVVAPDAGRAGGPRDRPPRARSARRGGDRAMRRREARMRRRRRSRRGDGRDDSPGGPASPAPAPPS